MKKSIKSWFPIRNIENGIIETEYNEYGILLEVIPINFQLKTKNEQQLILSCYKNLLNSCDFNMQILIISKRGNLDKHIKKIEENIKKEKDDKIINLMNEYITMIRVDSLKTAITKRFFIVILSGKFESKNVSKEQIVSILKERSVKVKNLLNRCGNEVKDFFNNTQEIINILYEYVNPNLCENQPLTKYFV